MHTTLNFDFSAPTLHFLLINLLFTTNIFYGLTTFAGSASNLYARTTFVRSATNLYDGTTFAGSANYIVYMSSLSELSWKIITF